MNGLGKCFFSTGDVYEGTFSDGVIVGRGKFSYEDGRVWEGDWKPEEGDEGENGEEGFDENDASGSGRPDLKHQSSNLRLMGQSYRESSRINKNFRAMGLGVVPDASAEQNGTDGSGAIPPKKPGRPSVSEQRRVSFKEQVTEHHIPREELTTPSNGAAGGCRCTLS